jgi:hypothetical protein
VPELQHSYITRGAAEVFIKRGIEDAWQKALGSDKGLEFFAEGGTGSRQLADALEGKKVTLPAEHRGVPAAVRTFLNELRELLNAHNAKTGQKPVAYRQDYLPHVVLGERSAPLSRLMELLELRSGTQMSEKEIEEYHDRFFDRRKGHPGYAKDATFAIKQYIHEAVKKLAWDEHLIATRKFLADASPADFDRANLIRDWTRSRFLQQKSTIGRNIDDLVSKMLFQHTMRGIEEIDLERAAKGAHTTVEDLKAQGIEKAYWVPPGVEYTAGTKSVDLGTWDGGRIVGAPKGDAVIATGSPIAHKWVRAAMHWKMGMPLLKIRNDEAWLRHRWKVERGLDDLQRSPSAMILGAITGRISSNIFWWNVGAAFINSTGPLLTTLPEYGLRAYAVGVYGTAKGVTRATVRAGLKAYVGAAERMGYLKPDQAEAARKSIPLLLAEVYAAASGVQQREMQMLEQRAADIADGKNPDVQAVLRALVYRGDVLFSTAEGLNRAQSIIAADHFARREFGVVRTVPQAFDSMEHARQEMLKALGDDGSPESFAARGTLLDQFAYDPGSFPMALSGAYGRTSFQLMRWTLAALKRYGLRPSEGAARVGYATMRGIKNAMLVESARSGPRAQRPGSREKLPPPKGWFEEWLDYNGANWQHRHAAAVFMRSTAIAAVLLGASIKAGIAFSNAGVPPHVMLALWLLRQFFQNDKDIQDWFEQGREGAMVSTNRLPVGPMAQGAVQFGGALGEAASQRGPVRLEKFPWESVMGTARLYLIRGQPEIARMMQAHPRWFEDHAPWAFKVFGVKTVMEDMTPAQQVKQQTRMLTAKERSELQRKP